MSRQRRSIGWLSGVLLGACAAVALAQPKKATPQQKGEATKEFRICHQVEKESDADGPPCWRLWLRKFKDVGSDAEVLYAEDHAKVGGAAPATRSTAPAASPPTPSTAPAPTAGSPSGGEPSNAPSSGTKPTATAAPETREEAPAAASSAPPASGAVLDFCTLRPKADSKSFVKQRVIVFAPANASAIEDDGALKNVEGGRVLREVFAARFPLARFHNVVTTLMPEPEWAHATSLATADLRQHLGTATQEARFVAYSAGCADYLVFPVLSGHKAAHDQAKLTLSLDGTLSIFKRDGDAFKLVSAVDASIPTLGDRLSDKAAAAASSAAASANNAANSATSAVPKVPGLPGVPGVGDLASGGAKVPGHISAIPTGCQPTASSDGTSGLAGCAKDGQLNGSLVVSASDEHLGEICMKASSGSGPPNELANAATTCEVRVRTFQLARALQKATRKVEGWQLFDLLAKGTREDPDAPGISIGRVEGLSVGYAFQAVDGNNKRLGFLKVTDVGPGGEKGASERTRLKWRSGEAPPGARIEEYPQLGISLSPYGELAVNTFNYAVTHVDLPSGYFANFELPKVMFGGGATVGYDLSSLLGIPEIYFRAGAAYLTGKGLNTTATLLPIEAMFEKGFYIGSSTWYFALGGTFTSVNVRILETEFTLERELSAKVFGPVGRTGFDFYLAPYLTLRLEVVARVPVTAAAYETSDGFALGEEWERRQDHFANVGAGLGFGYTF